MARCWGGRPRHDDDNDHDAASPGLAADDTDAELDAASIAADDALIDVLLTEGRPPNGDQIAVLLAAWGDATPAWRRRAARVLLARLQPARPWRLNLAVRLLLPRR